MNIDRNIKTFLSGRKKDLGRHPLGRYASFDYCYNYFKKSYDKSMAKDLIADDRLELSCLQLGFYLASWGMFRGSSFLLERSVKYFQPLIEKIQEFDPRIWKIDIDSYTDDNINLIIEYSKVIGNILKSDSDVTSTLITKTMLGIFGNVPALDTYFRQAFKIYRLNKVSLLKMAAFYNKYKTQIDKYKIYTINFSTGKETKYQYTKAKLIDMIGFIEGFNKTKKR